MTYNLQEELCGQQGELLQNVKSTAKDQGSPNIQLQVAIDRLRKEEAKNEGLEVRVQHLKTQLDDCENELKVMCTYSVKSYIYKSQWTKDQRSQASDDENDPKEANMNTIMEKTRENMMQKERMETVKRELATLKSSSRKESKALQQGLTEANRKVSQLEAENADMKSQLTSLQSGTLVSEPCFQRWTKAHCTKVKEYGKVKQDLTQALATGDGLRKSLTQANLDRE